MRSILLLSLLVLIGITSCKKEKLSGQVLPGTPEASTETPDSIQNYGCGNIHTTEALQDAIISYKTRAVVGDTVIFDRFWITKIYGNLHVNMIVCNEDALPEMIRKMKDNNDYQTELRVKCSGEYRSACINLGTNTGDFIYNYMMISKIEVVY